MLDNFLRRNSVEFENSQNVVAGMYSLRNYKKIRNAPLELILIYKTHSHHRCFTQRSSTKGRLRFSVFVVCVYPFNKGNCHLINNCPLKIKQLLDLRNRTVSQFAFLGL